MNNIEFARRLGILYNRVLSRRKDEDYIVNPPQMDKLIAIAEFFSDEAERLDGEMETIKLIPREEHAGVTTKFPVFDLYGERLQRFCELMKHTSAFGIDALADDEGVCISCTVPNVFIRKEDIHETIQNA